MAELGNELVHLCIGTSFQGKALVLGTLQVLPGEKRHGTLGCHLGQPGARPPQTGWEVGPLVGQGLPRGARGRPPGSTHSTPSSSGARCELPTADWGLWAGVLWGEDKAERSQLGLEPWPALVPNQEGSLAHLHPFSNCRED